MIKETYTTPKSIEDVVTELQKIRTNMTWADIKYLIEDTERLVEEDKMFQDKVAELEDELAELNCEYEDLLEDYKCLKAQSEEGEDGYF